MLKHLLHRPIAVTMALIAIVTLGILAACHYLCHIFVADQFIIPTSSMKPTLISGDNVCNSHDSRFFGLVPEDYIIGVVKLINYSRDRQTDEINWDRWLKAL